MCVCVRACASEPCRYRSMCMRVRVRVRCLSIAIARLRSLRLVSGHLRQKRFSLRKNQCSFASVMIQFIMVNHVIRPSAY